MRNIVIHSIGDQVFLSLKDHDFDKELVTEDLHSLQLTKRIADCYLNIRLLRYGQYYTEIVQKKNTNLDFISKTTAWFYSKDYKLIIKNGYFKSHTLKNIIDGFFPLSFFQSLKYFFALLVA